jgi:hypothetical protein
MVKWLASGASRIVYSRTVGQARILYQVVPLPQAAYHALVQIP